MKTRRSANLDQILEEHRELRETLAGLRGFLDEPRPGLGEVGSHSWAAEYSKQLVLLHDKLSLHFRAEEAEDGMTALTNEFPRAARDVRSLLAEHGDILIELRQLLEAVMDYAEGREPPRQDLRNWAHSVLELLRSHEERETELITRLYSEDLGTGD